jgi:hypothetical protein
VAAASESRTAEKAGTSYQTTYYPGTTDRSQAAPIQLHAGDDFPVSFSLVQSPSVSIHGSVVNLPPHTSATIMLQSRDFGVVMNGGEMHKDGSFAIRDVSPGNYTIVASVDGSAVPMMTRQSLQVGASGVDGLRLAPQPGATIRGRLRVESVESARRFDPEQIFVALQPEDGEELGRSFLVPESASSLVHVMRDGSFEWNDVLPGNYYVQFTSTNGADLDCFVKSVLMGGREVNDSGITVNGGTVTLEVVASMNAAILDGAVSDAKGQAVANAVVVAVPDEQMRRSPDRYGKTVSDQSGRFSLHGIRPGSYTLFAWASVDGDAYYDPEFLKSYEGQGSRIRIAEGERKTVQLPAILAAEDHE